VLLLYEIAARRWLTPYRADALTLEAVASGQLSVVSIPVDHWQLIAGFTLELSPLF
jgi:hypothetical protein